MCDLGIPGLYFEREPGSHHCNFETRQYNEKRCLIDKYGDKYQFAEGPHKTGWTNISTVLKNDKEYKLKGGIQRGSFMWKDKEGYIHIVHGVQGKKGKEPTKKKDVVKNLGNNICKVSFCGGKWDNAWGCHWHNWDGHDKAYIEFLKFTTECNFLEK